MSQRTHSNRCLVVGDLACDHYGWGDVNRVPPEVSVQMFEWEREANWVGDAPE